MQAIFPLWYLLVRMPYLRPPLRVRFCSVGRSFYLGLKAVSLFENNNKLHAYLNLLLDTPDRSDVLISEGRPKNSLHLEPCGNQKPHPEQCVAVPYGQLH